VGLTSSLGSATPEVAINGNSFVTISHSLTGLGSTSDYYFRVVARSPEGVRTSSIVQFRTHHLFTPEPVAGPSLMNIRASDWGDFDNDGRLDLIVLSDMVSRIYRNEGNSQFSITTNNISVASSVCSGDYNNDGHLDLLTSKGVYRNNGDARFTRVFSFPPVTSGAAKWADFNNDGSQDVLFAGQDGQSCINRIYLNTVNGDFATNSAVLPAFSNRAPALSITIWMAIWIF